MASEPDFKDLQHRYEDDSDGDHEPAAPAGVTHAVPVAEAEAEVGGADSQGEDEDDWLNDDGDYDIDAALDWAEAREGATPCSSTCTSTGGLPTCMALCPGHMAKGHHAVAAYSGSTLRPNAARLGPNSQSSLQPQSNNLQVRNRPTTSSHISFRLPPRSHISAAKLLSLSCCSKMFCMGNCVAS